MRTTYTMVVSFDDLQEEGWSVLHWLGEDLEQVAIVIIVHQDIQFLYLHVQTRKKEENIIGRNFILKNKNEV